jgi:hypothetical protein
MPETDVFARLNRFFRREYKDSILKFVFVPVVPLLLPNNITHIIFAICQWYQDTGECRNPANPLAIPTAIVAYL